ncbi:Ubiquitin family protein [Candida albicans]|uniref:Ubiquitin family protein n=1 Tax=Candida albicans TaxID=5476 RepID=A0A8H6BXF7_CANAX|nr:Ubiquitin family protein [Candida albicans]
MSESITITIKSSGDKKYEVTFDPSITVSQLKELVAEKSDIPAGSQRLIYSGKVLKDTETVTSYKVQNGHTIHLVKTAPQQSTANQSSSTPANASVPSNIAAGQGSFNPLADLTGARYAGYSQLPSASMFGPDGGMNSNIPDPEQLNSMMSNPLVQQQMQAMLSDPQMLDFMIQQNPQLRAMGPEVRQMLQSPFFRQMMSNPEMLRSMMQMERGNAEQTNAFPAPGANPTTGESGNSGETTATPANPFANLFPNGIPPINPSALFGGAAPAPAAAAAAPADNRPPEERYENQLRQLNDMGFYDFDRNVEALRRTGGSVQGAIEYLLGGN